MLKLASSAVSALSECVRECVESLMQGCGLLLQVKIGIGAMLVFLCAHERFMSRRAHDVEAVGSAGSVAASGFPATLVRRDGCGEGGWVKLEAACLFRDAAGVQRRTS